MKTLLFSITIFLTAISVNAQTLLFGGALGNGDFENGTSGWTIVNGTQANKWVVSNNATAGFSGNSCMYISNSASAPFAHTYNVNSPTYSYFYKDVAIPAGTAKVYLVFDYISNGEFISNSSGTDIRDCFRIYNRSTTENVVAGQELNNTVIFGSPGFALQSTWKKKYVAYLNASTFVGGNMRIIFQWLNNGSLGNQPPAALDNIECYATCQAMLPVSESSSPGIGVNFAGLVWNNISGTTGYNIRYKKITEPNTVSTYTTPITINGGNSYYTTINNLASATDYIAEIKPIGTACTEYTAPFSFKTLTPPAFDSCLGATLIQVQPNSCVPNLASFLSTTSSSVASSCATLTNTDVWYKFVALQPKQIIQAWPGYFPVQQITVYSGTCNSLTEVPASCSNVGQSVTLGVNSHKAVVDGLTVGNTYFVRVTANAPDATSDFNICIFNDQPLPTCPTFISPANALTNVNGGIPLLFKWNRAANNIAYKVQFIEQTGAYTEINTVDTFYLFTPMAGINYTWKVFPYNLADVSNTCTTQSFATCPVVANNVTISATGSLEICRYSDSVKLKTSVTNSGMQWFFNNLPIAGQIGDSIWAKNIGKYTVRKLTGACYGAPSNELTVDAKFTPVKPVLTYTGNLAFCQSGSVVLNAGFNVNNQWFNTGSSISGANGQTYTANTTGNFYVRLTNTTSGCSSYSDTVSVTITPTPATPVVTVTGSTTICNGDSVKLQSSATNGNQWFLNNVAIANATNAIYYAKTSGNFTVKQSVLNCTSNASLAVTTTLSNLPAVPVISAAGNDLTTTTGLATYKWFFNNVEIVGATSFLYTALAAGVYNVEVGNSAGCKSKSANYSHIVSAVNNITITGTKITLYPNPVVNNLYLNIEGASILNSKANLNIYSANGVLVKSVILKQGVNSIPLYTLPAGTYNAAIIKDKNRKAITFIKTI